MTKAASGWDALNGILPCVVQARPIRPNRLRKPETSPVDPDGRSVTSPKYRGKDKLEPYTW